MIKSFLIGILSLCLMAGTYIVASPLCNPAGIAITQLPLSGTDCACTFKMKVKTYSLFDKPSIVSVFGSDSATQSGDATVKFSEFDDTTEPAGVIWEITVNMCNVSDKETININVQNNGGEVASGTFTSGGPNCTCPCKDTGAIINLGSSIEPEIAK